MASTTTQEPSISSFNGGFRWVHDVFISFRGKDTGNNFTSHLYQALCLKGLKTFFTDDEAISSSVLEAIEKSRILMIVFSKNYAYSRVCLDELVKILECNGRQMVWPIFYDVEPSEVRKQTGNFGKALAEHEENCGDTAEKVQRWRSALKEAANLSGWHLGNEHEAKFIQKIIEEVMTKLNRTSLLNVAAYPVGIDSHLQEMNLLLNIESAGVSMIGVSGISGIGKTTIAKAIYNNFADQFEGSSFLADVRDISKQPQGLLQLQETLLFEMLGDKQIKLFDIHKGINVIRSWLGSKRVFLVLDDVDQKDQLDALAGECDWYGEGSRIIVTSRDESLLVSHGVESVYKAKELNVKDALQLFSWYAFKKPTPEEGYEELAYRAVNNAKGIPLALKFLGSKLYGRNISQWESELDRLERFPKKKFEKCTKF